MGAGRVLVGGNTYCRRHRHDHHHHCHLWPPTYVHLGHNNSSWRNENTGAFSDFLFSHWFSIDFFKSLVDIFLLISSYLWLIFYWFFFLDFWLIFYSFFELYFLRVKMLEIFALEVVSLILDMTRAFMSSADIPVTLPLLHNTNINNYVMWCDTVMWWNVRWCDVVRCDAMRCNVTWWDVMCCFAVRCDVVRCESYWGI
jgi:hypothetical protein